MVETDITLEQNELLQSFENDNATGTTDYVSGNKRKPIVEIIAENILNDYEKGVYITDQKLGCQSVTNASGKKIADWRLGQLIPLNSVITHKDGRLWRVVGRTYERKGYPYLTLQLEELI